VDWFAAMKMFAFLLRYLHAWRRYDTAVKELSNLNNRELADVRITRLDIRRVAWDLKGSDSPSDQLDRVAPRPNITNAGF
jgi:uncharacterized protein YjiS (DUF1127 family)